MSQPDRRSLLIGACRKRQDQIRHKLAQVRQRLQITDGLDNERWAQVERDLLARYDQEEERVQRLLNESQESLDAPHSHETTAAPSSSAEPTVRPEPGRAQLLALQQNYKKAQLLVAQKNEQIARLQKQLESRTDGPVSSDVELLVKEQTIAKLRQQNQALSAQIARLKAEVVNEEELDELHRQNEALSKALGERDQRLASLQEEWEELHRQNGALSNELSYRDQQEAELRAEILRLQELPPGNEVELEDLQRQNEYLNQELSLREQSEGQLRGEMTRLQAQNAALSQQVNQQTEAVVELTHQNEVLRADLDLKNEVTGRVQFDLELKTGEFDRLSRDYQQRGVQLEQLQTRLDELLKEAASPDQLASQSAAHQQQLLEQLAQQAEKHEQELARQLALQAEQFAEQLDQALQAPPVAEDGEKEQLQARLAELEQQLEQALQAPPVADDEEKEQLQARLAELEQQLEQALQAPPAEDGEKEQLQARLAELEQQLDQALQAPPVADDEEKEQLQARLAELEQQLEQALQAPPADDEEKQRLRAQVTQLEEKIVLQADKFQLELELLRSAQQYVSDELAKMLETPIGAAPIRTSPPVNRSGYLGGDPDEPPPARPPARPAAPAAPAASKPKPSGWLGSPDDEPWDGYVRPNYSKAGLPPGAAGAAKVAARAANLGLSHSSEEAARPLTGLGELPPLDLDSQAAAEETPDWLTDPVAAGPDELPDWLTAEKPTD
ncbi:MAG: hypothetical protein KF760_29295 [Candidatus Eremiobacteraeota bacterium]|nr:hypothetical protein [Candidatus Eremiobacteraeota bacterium]